MATPPKLNRILDSEYFGEGKRLYFIDIKKSRLEKPYLCITRLDRSADATRRSQIIIFEDDLPFFVEALSMVLGRLSYGQTRLF